MPKAAKGVIIGVGAVVLSTLAIQASDIVRGIEGSLPSLVSEQGGVCGSGATMLQLANQSLCVDTFENAVGDSCPHTTTNSPADTTNNLLDTSCQPVSEAHTLPWRFVSLTEAQQLCARVGKRLPTAAEWYKISLTLIDQSQCVINKNQPQLTGSTECKTDAGIYDLVGNVWEWVDASVTEGKFENRDVPASGFVAMVDNNGVVLETSDTPSDSFGQDYALTSHSGVFGVIRGGFYGGEDDAGIFAQNLAVPFDLRTTGLGFRCVRDL